MTTATMQIDKVVESFSSYYKPGDTFNRRSFMSKIDFKSNSFYIDTAIKRAVDSGIIRVKVPMKYTANGVTPRVLEYVGTPNLNEVVEMSAVPEQVNLVETVEPETEKLKEQPKEQLKIGFNDKFDQLINLANSFKIAEKLVRNLAQESLLEKPTGLLISEATKEEVLNRLKEILVKEAV